MLTERLDADLKAAMREGDKVRLRTLRALKTAITEREIENRKGGTGSISEEEEIAVLQRQAKQRRDSIEQFETASRPDLAEAERDELEILETYLPTQMTDDEILAVLREVIEEVGATEPRDMGRVMGATMPRVQGRADGRRINELARDLLTGNA